MIIWKNSRENFLVELGSKAFWTGLYIPVLVVFVIILVINR
jgi:hypothetical protein